MRFPNNCCGKLPASGASFKTYMCAKKTFEGKPKNKVTRSYTRNGQYNTNVDGDGSIKFPNNCCDELLASEASRKIYLCAKKTFGRKPKNKIMTASTKNRQYHTKVSPRFS